MRNHARTHFSQILLDSIKHLPAQSSKFRFLPAEWVSRRHIPVVDTPDLRSPSPKPLRSKV